LKAIIVILNFIIYFILCINKKNNFKIPFSILFFLLSFVFFLLVDFSKMPDYQEYFDVIGLQGKDGAFNILFSEPYYFQLVNFFNLSLSKEASINVFYFINTLITTSFFIWISFKEDISPWKKVFLYSMYYYLFSFVLLRNTPSYILLATSFYYLNYKKIFLPSLLSFLCHISSLPLIVFSFFKNKKANFLLIFICFGYIFLFNILTKLEVFGIYEKLTIYKDDNQYGQGLFHKIYFYLFIILNLILLLFKKDLILNYTYVFIFLTYIFLQFIGPVMGFRFSIYLIFYLIMTKNYKEVEIKNYSYFNILSFFTIIILVFNYIQLF
jgi:hypothetical protein